MPVSWSILIGKRIATEKRREGAATIWLTSDQSAQRVVAGRPAARPWCGYAGALAAQHRRLAAQDAANFAGLVLGCIEAKFCK